MNIKNPSVLTDLLLVLLALLIGGVIVTQSLTLNQLKLMSSFLSQPVKVEQTIVRSEASPSATPVVKLYTPVVEPVVVPTPVVVGQ